MGDQGVTPARRGRPGYDQETVLRRAIDLFNAQGYDATSIGDLAKELGLTKSAIYHHVPSKQTLLSLALDEALDGLSEAIEAAVDEPGTSAHQRLRNAVEASVLVLAHHLPAVTLLLRVRGNSDVEVAGLRRRRDLDARFAALVSEAVAQLNESDTLPYLVVVQRVAPLVPLDHRERERRVEDRGERIDEGHGGVDAGEQLGREVRDRAHQQPAGAAAVGDEPGGAE